jgi:hypothetical protein
MTSLGNHNDEPDDGRSRRDAPDPGPDTFSWGFFLSKPFQENVFDAAAQRPDGVARFIGLLEVIAEKLANGEDVAWPGLPVPPGERATTVAETLASLRGFAASGTRPPITAGLSRLLARTPVAKFTPEPSWRLRVPGPPGGLPPVAFGRGTVLARFPQGVVFADSVRAWPEGCSFTITLSLDEGTSEGRNALASITEARRTEPADRWEVLATLFDLSVQIDDQPPLRVHDVSQAQPSDTGLFSHHAGGRYGWFEELFWLTPLPRGRTMRLVVDGKPEFLNGVGEIDITALAAPGEQRRDTDNRKRG